jgi:hypothetical protein
MGRQSGEVFDGEYGLAGDHLFGITRLQLEADAGAGVVSEGVEHARRQLLLVLVRQVEAGAEAAGGGQGVAEIGGQP